MSLSVESAVRTVFNANAAEFGNAFTDLYLGRVPKNLTSFPWAAMWAPNERRSFNTSDTTGILKELQVDFYARTLEEIALDTNPQAYAIAFRRVFDDEIDLSLYNLGCHTLKMWWKNSVYFQDEDRVFHYTLMYDVETSEAK